MPKVKLTAATIDRLKAPAEGQIEYFDAAFSALALRVTAKNVRSWVYFGRVAGRLTRATLGRWPAMGLADARKAATAIADSMRAGIDPAGAKRAARKKEIDTDFAKVVDEWLANDRPGKRSIANIGRSIAKDVTPMFRGRPIASITTEDAQAAIEAIVARGAVIQARRVHAYMHRLFRWAVTKNKMLANPLTDVLKPGEETERSRVLNDSELAAVWRAADTVGWPFGPVVKLLMLTAARLSEIGSLTWAEIVGDTIELDGSRTKNKTAFVIPLSTAAAAVVAVLPRIEGADYVFTVTGRSPVSGWSKAKKAIDTKVAEMLKESDPKAKPMTPWTFHDLRRSAATGMAELKTKKGKPVVMPDIVEAVLNHKRPGVAGTYNRALLEAPKRLALEAWGRHLMQAISTTSGAAET